MQASFGHLSGYGAGYYSYLFCRVFSANIWHRCFEPDPLNRQSNVSSYPFLFSLSSSFE